MARSSRLWELQYPLPFESYNLCQRANGSAKNFFGYVMCLISLNYFFATVQDQYNTFKGGNKATLSDLQIIKRKNIKEMFLKRPVP